MPVRGGRGRLASLSRIRALASLQHRNFRLLWLGHSLTSMAFWMDQVSRGWLIYELTNSALQLGMVRGIQALPILFLSPVAGSAADRLSRKKQIVLSQVVDGCMYGMLTLLIFTQAIKPWHVYLSAFVMAVDQTFLQPARAAIIADAVPRDHLTNAIGLNSMIFNTARSTGPALAGILIAKYGTAGSYATQAIFCALATLWTMQLRSRTTSPAAADDSTASETSFLLSVVEGWKFSWRNEEVRTGLMVVMLVALLIVPFTTLLPIFARDILSVGATGQGLLLTAMGVGALSSAVTIASLGDRMDSLWIEPGQHLSSVRFLELDPRSYDHCDRVVVNRAEPWIQNYHLGELCPQDVKNAKLPPAPPGAIEASDFFRQQIKRTKAREKTLFPNEASNYQLGGQFAAVAGFVLDRARKKGLGRDLPSEWFAQTLLP